MKIVCPLHHIPDCSALLNGCSIPSYIHARLTEARAEAWEEGTAAGWPKDSIGYKMHRSKLVNPYRPAGDGQ